MQKEEKEKEKMKFLLIYRCGFCVDATEKQLAKIKKSAEEDKTTQVDIIKVLERRK